MRGSIRLHASRGTSGDPLRTQRRAQARRPGRLLRRRWLTRRLALASTHDWAGDPWGGLLLEILVAFAILVMVFVPLLSSFQTGLRHARAVRSYTAARCLADWALANGRAWVAFGLAQQEDRDLTAQARLELGGIAQGLEDLSVRRRIRPEGSSGRLFRLQVDVLWQDPPIEARRVLRAEAMERAEI